VHSIDPIRIQRQASVKLQRNVRMHDN